jgi:hypothetical protein
LRAPLGRCAAQPRIGVRENGDAEGGEVERDPACLRMKADDGYALVAGIADEDKDGDTQSVQQEHRHHSDGDHHERPGKAVLAPEEPEPRGAESEHQPHALEPRAHLRDLHREASGAEDARGGITLKSRQHGLQHQIHEAECDLGGRHPQHLADLDRCDRSSRRDDREDRQSTGPAQHADPHRGGREGGEERKRRGDGDEVPRHRHGGKRHEWGVERRR